METKDTMSEQQITHEIVCSCGVPGCPELGWPHEWDPIAADDSCTLGGLGSGALRAFYAGDPDPVLVRVDPGGYSGPLLDFHHAVREPYERWGSGYACRSCVDAEAGES